jgi:hypothetical protein
MREKPLSFMTLNAVGTLLTVLNPEPNGAQGVLR